MEIFLIVILTLAVVAMFSEALPRTFDSSFIFAIPGLGSRHSLPG